MIRQYSITEFEEQYLEAASLKAHRQHAIQKAARTIIEEVRNEGDKAVARFSSQFDGKVPSSWTVTEEERALAWREVPPALIQAMKQAADNIRAFHSGQLQQSRILSAEDGFLAGQLFLPIEKVGMYVPGGTAAYPSSVLMNAIPARIAGVTRLAMATPARGGTVPPALIVAADIAKVDVIYKIGGCQAIAAFAYGTESVERVDKIVGPGNAYVAAAKSLVFGDVGIDMIAGPSEVAVIADESANPTYIAADLLAQAEHDELARCILITTSDQIIQKVNEEISLQCTSLPRKHIASGALENNSAAIRTNSLDEAFCLSNRLAPEHLEIHTADPFMHIGKIKNAGSVFLGPYTPEAAGDYYAGPNHVLPTSGTARFSSGLSVDDFIKKTTYLSYSRKALEKAAESIITLAGAEGLEAHARAVEARIKK